MNLNTSKITEYRIKLFIHFSFLLNNKLDYYHKYI